VKAVSSAAMRELDRRAIEERGIPAATLMDRAGQQVARAVAWLRRRAGCDPSVPVVLVAGCGNNGGDAFAAARHLAARNVSVRVLLAGRADAVSPTAAVHLAALRGTGLAVEERNEGEWPAQRDPDLGPGAVIVDGLLGTGFRGAPRGAVGEAIRWIGAQSAGNRVVAIDLPSGLDGDTGEATEAVAADLTVTLAFPKTGLLHPAALPYAGHVLVADIGIPRDLADGLPSDRELITAEEVAAWLGARPRAAHKGRFGTVLVLAGARGYAGAAALAGRAALRAGAGLVHVATPRGVASVVAGFAPELMVHPVAETAAGCLAAEAWTELAPLIERVDAIAVGPGLTTGSDVRTLVGRVIAVGTPLVLDADALNLLGRDLALLRDRRLSAVLTPHPGEMGRLLGLSADAVQADRTGAARRAAVAGGAVVALKGAGTVVVGPAGAPAWINLTGNPGMATAGSGDVLTGVVGALLARAPDAFAACAAGVYLHGFAGDLAAWARSDSGLLASDISDALPAALGDVRGV
jgi:NAD(P)H-hydrate epimerase